MEGALREAALRQQLERRLQQATAAIASAAPAYRRTNPFSLKRMRPDDATTAAAPPVPRLPPPPAAPRRTVCVPSASFVKSDDGRGLQRRKHEPPSAATSTAAPARRSVDYKKQRLAVASSLAKAQTLCTAFCRRGRCDATRDCPYDHDPLKVAICQAFLHGQCDAARVGDECPLSHAPTPHNMPTCRLYVRGLCIDAHCPFPHLHLGANAPLCEAFSRCGYCDDGAACEKRHELLCAGRGNNGACALGERCRLGRRAPPRRGPPPPRAQPLADPAPPLPPEHEDAAREAVPRRMERRDSTLPCLPSPSRTL